MIDLGIVDAPQCIVQVAQAQLGPASILVNNATHDDSIVPFDHLDAPTLDAYYAVNMRGTMLLSVEFARSFVGPAGESSQGHGAMPSRLAYVATKGAIETFTVILARKWHHDGSQSTRLIPVPPIRGG